MQKDVASKPGAKLGILAVGLTFNNDTKAAQKSFMETNGYRWASGFDAGDVLSKRHGIVGVPTAIILDPEGKVVTFGFYAEEWAGRLDAFLKQTCLGTQ